MKKKHGILVAIISALVVLIVALIIALVIILVVNSPEKKFEKLMADGQEQMELESYDTAIEIYESAIELMPENAAGYIGLANVYICLADEYMNDAEAYIDKDKIEKATKSYESAIEYYELARDVLKKRAKKIDSSEIKSLLKKVEGYIEDANDVLNEVTMPALPEGGVSSSLDTTYTEDSWILSEEYAAAYLPVFNDLEYSMSNYYWQYGVEYGEWGVEPVRESTPVAITDITGDGIPEIIIMFSPTYISSTSMGSASLNIYTIGDDGNAECLYVMDGFDRIGLGGYSAYYLFKNPRTGKMYVCLEDGDDEAQVYIKVFDYDDNGNMTMCDIVWKASVIENYETGERSNYYYSPEGDITEEEYNAVLDSLLLDSSVIMYSSDASIYEDKLILGDMMAMTIGEAYRILTVPRDLADDKLPFEGELEFVFSSGAGGWGTDLTLFSDGSFVGSFSDSDMGVTGPGYPNGTVYYSNFSGSFSNIRRIDENTWAMDLDGYTLEDTPGAEKIENDIMWISSDPYGIEGGEEFLLYLPGTPVSDLPEDFVWWIWGLRDNTTLSRHGLYNVHEGQGFAGYN